MKDGASGKGEQPLFSECKPLQRTEALDGPNAQKPLERGLDGVDLEAVVNRTRCLAAARRRVRPAAPSDRLSEKMRRHDTRKFGHQPVGPQVKAAACDEEMNPGTPVVIPRQLVIKAKQF